MIIESYFLLIRRTGLQSIFSFYKKKEIQTADVTEMKDET